MAPVKVRKVPAVRFCLQQPALQTPSMPSQPPTPTPSLDQGRHWSTKEEAQNPRTISVKDRSWTYNSRETELEQGVWKDPDTL